MPQSLLQIELRVSEPGFAELRYRFSDSQGYESQQRPLAEIQGLLDKAAAYFDTLPALMDLPGIGRRLFDWLDGEGRWLSRGIAQSGGPCLVLALQCEERLSHLPWEAMHDGTGFLVERVNPVVVPVRWLPGKAGTEAAGAELPQRPLQVLFMATSPEGVEPELAFEAEEAKILEATADLALRLRVEESGCLVELEKLWRRFGQGHFDVFHLSGHASIGADGVPYFITETEEGERCNAVVADFAKVFQFRFPKLMFLSGCRTGEGCSDAESGAVMPSLAEQLLAQGAGAVLSWGRPVSDVGASVAAAHLYGKLGAGYGLGEALASTYSHLRGESARDWSLLRLYVRGAGEASLGAMMGPLVPPPEDVYELSAEPLEQLFLDAEGKVRVASSEEFVGRRRLLQRCLKALRGRQLGVVLQGLGGVGKSTVAKRLLERLSGYSPLVVYRGLDEGKLVKLLGQQCETEAGHGILNGQLPLQQKLAKFFREGLNGASQRFVVVLDDFEANLEPRGEGYVIRGVQSNGDDPAAVLGGLLGAVVQSRLPHRVIITSRYRFPVAALGSRLHWEEALPALKAGELLKKCQRLAAFRSDSGVNEALQEQALRLCDGNPRLLEWLDVVLRDGQTDQAAILAAMEMKAAEYREDILAEALLGQQSEAVRGLLQAVRIFELPVPLEVVNGVVDEAWLPVQPLYERAFAVGLLEQHGDGAVRVPRVLPLGEDWSEGEYRRAAEVLYRVWREEAEGASEAQMLEMHRLALLGKAGEIAATLATALAGRWKNQSRFRETVVLCKSTLEMQENFRVRHQLARAEEPLGEVQHAGACHLLKRKSILVKPAILRRLNDS